MVGKKLTLRNMTVLHCTAISLKYGYLSTVIPYCFSRSTTLHDFSFALVSE